MVDALFQNWVAVVVEREDGPEGRGREGKHQSALLYVDGSMVASPDPGWLQGAFDTLVGLFNLVGLRMNTGKTVGMV